MCCSCFKKIIVKFIYIALIAAVFGAGLMMSFDTYVSSAVYQKSHYRDAEPRTSIPGVFEVKAKSNLFKIPYYTLAYNEVTKCVSLPNNLNTTFYDADEPFTVWGQTVVDGKYSEKEFTVTCT